MHTYLVVFYGAALLALVLTPVVVGIARALRVVDEPGVRKVHAAAIPRLGGVAIMVPTLLMVLPIFLLQNDIGRQFRDLQWPLATFFIASGLVFLIGLVDDVWGAKPSHKLVVEIIAAAAICGSGTVIDGFNLSATHHIAFSAWLSIPLTMLWIVGITNAVNLIDGLDGLAAGISLITCTVICAIAVYMQRPVMAVVMLGLIGSLIGFLFYNFNPAKIFLGDCGSLFLGFVLASTSVLTSHKTSTLLALALPLLALGVPIFDTLFSMFRRLLGRRSMFAPDREHIHHKLLSKGFQHRTAVLLLYGVTAGACGLGLLMVFVQDLVQVALFAGAIAFILLVFRFSGAISITEVLHNLRRNQAIAREGKVEHQRIEVARLALSEAQHFDAWWRGLCAIAEDLRFTRLEISAPGDETAALQWQAGANQPTQGRAVSAQFVLHDERGRPMACVRGMLARGRSFESAGRRMAHFGRLLDETAPRLLQARVEMEGRFDVLSQHPPVPSEG